jgi:hypothetical protein
VERDGGKVGCVGVGKLLGLELEVFSLCNAHMFSLLERTSYRNCLTAEQSAFPAHLYHRPACFPLSRPFIAVVLVANFGRRCGVREDRLHERERARLPLAFQFFLVVFTRGGLGR